MSSNTESCQDDEDEISPPLLVRIQTIDLHNLDFQTNVGIGSTAKFRHLTYIEATNLFLFVGSTSGTVYVFSRDTLKFLFIIPFKGGKVCNIACSQDESDIAVGSIRGKVSLYRISPNVHYMQSSASAPLIDAFRDIYDVPHHVGSEITEMQWSPNGKYLFVGDSQGILSQMDVACLDEFPRPVPSKIILKLQSRVLQIDCSFPYLAVCTLTAVFLCDLEKEDFTRVQHTKNTDIRSTGLCLMILPERSSLRDLARERTIPCAKLMLYIGEVGSGTIHCCNMEGKIQHSKKITVSSKVSTYSMSLFNPTKTTFLGDDPSVGAPEEENEVNISLGKMLCTDDGMIVSISSDRLFVYDPYTLNVIAWNEEFKRINNFKIISNYAFIWTGNKLEVVAFTPFRLYAEQLFRAKLIGVLENWIHHTVYSLGYRPVALGAKSVSQLDEEVEHVINDEDCAGMAVNKAQQNLEKAVWNFRRMVFSEGDEESEFTQFVLSQVPFPMPISTQIDDGLLAETSSSQVSPVPIVEEKSRVEKPIRLFLARIQTVLESLSINSRSASTDNNNSRSSSVEAYENNCRIPATFSYLISKSSGQSDFFQPFCEMWNALVAFYEDIECTLPQLDYKKSEMTLSHILNAAQSFLSQPNLVNIHQEIGGMTNISKFEEVAVNMIGCLHARHNYQGRVPTTDSILEASLQNNLPLICFTKFSQCPLVVQWFRELGTSPEALFYDGLLADTLLLLFPFCASQNEGLILATSLELTGCYDKLSKHFLTWLFLCKFLHKPKQVPYSPLLRSLLNDQLFEKLAEEMFSTIYRDFRLSSFGGAAHYLHHFVSALILLSKSPGCSQPRNVSILLSCFPLTKWAREDIVTKIIAACHINPALVGLYLKACLEDGNSMKLCCCGIQSGFGSLEEKVPPWQRAIEEAIIKLLLEEYFKSSPYDNDEEGDIDANGQFHDGNGNHTQKRRAEMLVHMFAMRRGLLEPYFRSPLPDEFLSEELQAELIVRSGSCASLKYYPCNKNNMSLLLRCHQKHFSPSIRTHSNNKDNINGASALEKTFLSRDKPSVKQSLPGLVSETKCTKCSFPLQVFSSDYKPLSLDCLGIWALKQFGNLERFIEFVQKCHLNTPATFSARFFRAVVKFSDEVKKQSLNGEYNFDSSGELSMISCSTFH